MEKSNGKNQWKIPLFGTDPDEFPNFSHNGKRNGKWLLFGNRPGKFPLFSLNGKDNWESIAFYFPLVFPYFSIMEKEIFLVA